MVETQQKLNEILNQFNISPDNKNSENILGSAVSTLNNIAEFVENKKIEQVIFLIKF